MDRVARALRLAIAALGVAIVALGFPAGDVAAHTDFESSAPADGDVVEGPLIEITISFTAAATPAGDGFVVLDPTGALRRPSSVDVIDGRIFVLGFDPPLGAGVVGVRWSVQAGDAHPIDGSFAFTVTSPPTATAPPSTVTSSPTATAPPSTVTSRPTATPPPSTGAAAPSTVAAPPADAPAATPAAAPPAGLDEFLSGDGGPPGQRRQLAGRIIGFVALIAAVGGLAFLATTLRGSRDEIAAGLATVATLALLAAAGATLEYWGLAARSDDPLATALTSTPGLAMALRATGGVALTVGAAVARSAVRPMPGRQRWDIRTAPLTVLGATLLVVSFWFDGHTVSRGPRAVHAIVNTVHVTAAAVWAGGVVVFAAVLWRRHRRDEPGHATELVVRFSTIAAISLAAVVAAGAAMTLMIVDGPGDLTGTEWGRTYLLKTGAVAAAALVGAYNHFRLRPALEHSPDDPHPATDLGRTLVAEAILLAFVAVVTAWLVAASTAG